MKHDLSCDPCTVPRFAIAEGCASDVRWVRVIDTAATGASVAWHCPSTGGIATTPPVGFTLGECAQAPSGGGSLTLVPVLAPPPATGNTGTLPRLEYLASGTESWLVGTDGNARQIEFASRTFAKVVYVDTTTPATATIFDDANPPVAHDPLLAGNDYNVYIGTDGSTWTWNGTGYVAYTPPARTPWYLENTTTDAGANKTANVYRQGAVLLATGGSGQTQARQELHVQAGGASTLTADGGGALLSTSDALGARLYLEHLTAAAGRRVSVIYTENGVTRIGAIPADDGLSWVVQNTLLVRNNGGPIAGAVGVRNANPVSHLDVGGSFGVTITKSTAANYPMTVLDHTFVSQQGNTTVTLPPPIADNTRREYVVKRDPAATGAVGVLGHIDNVASVTLNISPGQARKFQSDGTTWWVI